MNLYEYQQATVDALLKGKHFCCTGTGMGKGFIGLEWARKTRKKRVLVITQASKRDSDDYAKEARILDDKWYGSLSSFETISWNGLKKWLDGNLRQRTFDISEYAIIADECHRFKAGVSSGMGKAMLKIAKMTECWTGYTATPGDKWIDFCAYFMATNKVRTKTRFLDDYCYVQTFKGYPEIVEYRHEDVLKEWWREISFAPDSSSVDRQLPAEVGKVVHFKAPTGYKKVLATRKRLDTDEFIDTNMGLVQYARQLCFTKEKQQWCSDFIEGLGDNAVFFCNYIEEEDRLCELAEKVLPKGARVWRIDGKHHEIPTAETIGPRDIVVAHYQSGGASLNLQFIHYWVAVSANWSYSMNVQAKGRIRRIGQQHKMFYYYLMCDDCIDEDVYDTVHEKKDFAAKVWCLEKGFADDGSL